MGIFEKFKLGFKRSANNIASGLREIIVKKEIDDETLNKIEEFLISSDAVSYTHLTLPTKQAV